MHGLKGKRGNRYKHGESGVTPEYNAWARMKDRCYNKNVKYYDNYGGRGIKVCKRWLNSYENFIADMGRRPTDKHSLDRINVNGSYKPSNCRWATHSEQKNNMRKNVYMEFQGEKLTITQIAKRLNVPPGKLFWYLRDRKISLEKAIDYIKKGGENRKRIAAYNLEGIEIGQYPSIADAARKLKASSGHISACCRGKRARHHNMTFKFI